jgi:hypothetical protein
LLLDVLVFDHFDPQNRWRLKPDSEDLRRRSSRAADKATNRRKAYGTNSSERAVHDAHRLRKEDPAGFEQVKKGEKTLGQATNRKSRAKRGVDPEKLEAIAGAIGSEANMANSLFDGVSISAGEIKDLAGKSPNQIKRIYRLLRSLGLVIGELSMRQPVPGRPSGFRAP